MKGPPKSKTKLFEGTCVAEGFENTEGYKAEKIGKNYVNGTNENILGAGVFESLERRTGAQSVNDESRTCRSRRANGEVR